MARPYIQVVLAAETIPPSLRAALQHTPAATSFWPLAEALRMATLSAGDAVVVVVPAEPASIAGPLRVLFDRLAEHPRATLVMTATGAPVLPLQHPPALPVAFDGGEDEHALSVRLSAMLAMRDSLDCLHRGLLANRRSGESIAKRYANQLRLASQVQREFLPEVLPSFGPVSFDLLFRPVDYVSGDIYDVHRLDEDHVGIALADATGHGIPAALLTVYIKRALRGKEIENRSYRILSPDEVLSRLNDDILEAHLSECPFVAAVYAVLNTRTLELKLARAGVPYPIYRTSGGRLRMLHSRGGVVGVLPDARFEVDTVHLQPGDSLLIYSDGLERIIAPREAAMDVPDELKVAAGSLASWGDAPEPSRQLVASGVAGEELDAQPAYSLSTEPGGSATAVATAPPGNDQSPAHANFHVPDRLISSAWYATLRDHGPAAALEQAAGRQRALRRMGYPLDDVTVLCLQVGR